MAFAGPPLSPLFRRSFLSAAILGAAVVVSGCKETGASWNGTYVRYSAAMRNAAGKRVNTASNTGVAKLVVASGELTYDQTYGPNNNTHVVQVYTFQKNDIVKGKGGHDVKLVWKSMVKTPPTAGYDADNITPLLRVRGKGDNLHLELEFVDSKGTRGDIDFSVGGKNLSGIGDADFD